ncbi:protein tweety [Microdochium nivale]|nr:protein tweety [Microdochium nivale]
MVTGHGILWHICQVLPILASAAWAIACIVTLFTTPTRSYFSSSSSSSSSPFAPGGSFSNSSSNFDQNRNNMLILWAGGALGIVFTSLGLAMYVALVCVDSVARRGRSNPAAWGKRRKGVVWVTVVVRSIGVIAAVAVGAYYATLGQTRLIAPIVLAFVFTVAGLAAIVVSLVMKPKPVAPGDGQQQQYGYQQHGYQPQYGVGNGGAPPYGQHQQYPTGAPTDGHNPGLPNNGPTGWQAPPKA